MTNTEPLPQAGPWSDVPALVELPFQWEKTGAKKENEASGPSVGDTEKSIDCVWGGELWSPGGGGGALWFKGTGGQKGVIVEGRVFQA